MMGRHAQQKRKRIKEELLLLLFPRLRPSLLLLLLLFLNLLSSKITLTLRTAIQLIYLQSENGRKGRISKIFLWHRHNRYKKTLHEKVNGILKLSSLKAPNYNYMYISVLRLKGNVHYLPHQQKYKEPSFPLEASLLNVHSIFGGHH